MLDQGLSQLVEMRSGCTLLITSRDSEIVEFHKFELPVLPSENALQLFQALSVRTAPEERREIEILCQRLGNLPLAIRIAARWASERANRGKRLARLTQRFDNIVQSQEIQTSFTISWNSLGSDRLRRGFTCVGLFAGEDWDVAALAAALQCEIDEAQQITDELMNRCLLEGGRSEMRYAVHPLLREYAHAKLEEEDRAHWYITEHYRSLAVQMYERLNSPDAVAATQRLDLELGNLRGVWRFCAHNGTEKAAQAIGDLLANLWEFLLARGHIDYVQDLFFCARKATDRFNHPETLAELYYGQAMLTMAEGNALIVKDGLREAARYYEQIQNIRRQVEVQSELAYLFIGLGDLLTARSHAKAAMKIARILAKPRDLGRAHTITGAILAARGLMSEALQHYEQALMLLRTIGNPSQIAALLREIGSLYLFKDDPDTALTYMLQSLAIVEGVQYLDHVSFTLCEIGNAHVQRQRYDEADSYYRRALTTAQRTGNVWLLGAVTCGLAEICLNGGKLDLALDYYRQAMQYAEQVESPEKQSIVLRGISEVLIRKQQLREAMEYSRRALNLGVSVENKEETLFAVAYSLASRQSVGTIRIKQTIKNLLLNEKERATFLIILAKSLREHKPDMVLKIGGVLEDIKQPLQIEDIYKSDRIHQKYNGIDTVGKLLSSLLLQTVEIPSSNKTRIMALLIKEGYWPRDIKVSDAVRYVSTRRWGGGGGCFPAGTNVMRPDGPVAIEQLRIGDMVLCQDMANGKLRASTVASVYCGQASGYYIINDRLRVTATHSIYTNKGWTMPPEISEGDYLYNMQQEAVLIQSIQFVDGIITIYNMRLNTVHTFFSENVLVHNPRATRKGQ